MVSKPSSGFQEIDHTADWELQVWAPDFPALLECAARGMSALTEITLAKEPRVFREFVLPRTDRETLLVDFLSELLFFAEHQGIAFDTYNLKLNANSLVASVEGAAIENQAKEIKAVTYHRLSVQSTDRGLEVNLVFDV
ncbi:MAG: archease [Chloroflexi bacterium]|nr:archease [Chloroflexota bacterium]